MGKRVRISNERLNSYGTRVLTDGMDTEQYSRNPVLLYMHERGNVIGYVKGLKVENGEVTGELMFDCASELSERCKKQFEFGSLRMVSAGLDILEMSQKKELLVEGQTSPTITRSRLVEVSVADIGANDDALVLQRDGKRITLGRDGQCPLPLLDKHITIKNQENMELKTIALQLGLPETADEAAVGAELARLKKENAECVRLRKEMDVLSVQELEAIVDGAVSQGKISAERKPLFLRLGKELGREVGAKRLREVFDAMQPQARLSSLLQGGKSGAPEWKKLGDVPPSQLLELKRERPEEYRRLYEAEYGMACDFE